MALAFREATQRVDSYMHDKVLRPIFESFGEYHKGPLKDVQRAVDKARNDYDGDPSRVLDWSRSTTTFSSPVALERALAKLEHVASLETRAWYYVVDARRDDLANLPGRPVLWSEVAYVEAGGAPFASEDCVRVEAFRAKWLDSDVAQQRETMSITLADGGEVRFAGEAMVVSRGGVERAVERRRSESALSSATRWFIALDPATCAALDALDDDLEDDGDDVVITCRVAAATASNASESFLATAPRLQDSRVLVEAGADRKFKLHCCRPPRIVRVKDHLSKPAPSGYRSLLVNYEYAGVIAEIQLMPASFYVLKARTHVLYSIIREIYDVKALGRTKSHKSLKLSSLPAPRKGGGPAHFLFPRSASARVTQGAPSEDEEQPKPAAAEAKSDEEQPMVEEPPRAAGPTSDLAPTSALDSAPAATNEPLRAPRTLPPLRL